MFDNLLTIFGAAAALATAVATFEVWYWKRLMRDGARRSDSVSLGS